MNSSLERLANQELLVATHALVRRGRVVEAELLRHLGEVDARRLYLGEACPSMFAYCVRVLHFSEAAAYKRIRAARAARLHPELLVALRGGDLHLTAVSLLAGQLSSESCAELIAAATHKTTEEIKRMLADRRPKPDVADCVRRVRSLEQPERASATVVLERGGVPPSVEAKPNSALVPNEADRRPTTTAPLGGERYRVSFTADGKLHGQLQELRALLRHQVPNGDLASILGRAVSLLLEQVRERKFADVSKPKPAFAGDGTPSRKIPAAIRRAVTRRDGGRCGYVSPGGRVCGTQEFLEFHHVEPWARSRTHSVDGIALRCRAHNQYEACRDFGEEHMASFRKQAGPGGPSHRATEGRDRAGHAGRGTHPKA